tara:strand:- start:117 stop:854 length:738 start_codon:yes stop_codon:yes gene_type:complete
MKSILDFIPLLFVIILSSLSDDIKHVWFTSLGKLFAIILIIFYSFIDKYIGLGVCIMVVFFYNTYDFYIFEGLENSDQGEDQGEDDEEADLSNDVEKAMDIFDMDDLAAASKDVMGEDVTITSEENTIVDMEKQLLEKQKLEIQENKDAKKFELEQNQQNIDQEQVAQEAKRIDNQIEDAKNRKEIDFLKDILYNRTKYSNSIITQAESRIEELLFDKGTNKTDTNNTIKKIETFTNLIPKLTRM